MTEGPLRITPGRTVQVPEALCTGRGWVDHLASGIPPSRTRVVKAFFEPGSRTAWHVHQHGQILHVLDGNLVVQERGEPAEVVPVGGSVACTPGVWHWHGSDRDRTLVVIGVVDLDDTGNEAQWGEKVTDAEYAAALGE